MRNIPNLELHRQRLDQLRSSKLMSTTLAARAGQIQPSRVRHAINPSAQLCITSRGRWSSSSSAGYHLQRGVAAAPQQALLVEETHRPASPGEPASCMPAAIAEEGGHLPELGAGLTCL
uniref:Uncharacterized protein n=1 Tax=Arundo donax TaxID=35708 RepID=A0A0A9DZE1_ARUDO